MLTAKEFVAKIEAENEPLFKAGEMQIKHYYEKNADNKDELIDNFTGRMVNERMNMEEISREVAALPAGTDPEKLVLLSKQAHDEAKHFQFVREVVEYLKGEKIDIFPPFGREERGGSTKSHRICKNNKINGI